MTNQPDTWKENFDTQFAKWHLASVEPQEFKEFGLYDYVVMFIENLLSSSQALARRSGIEEAMRVVEGMKGRKKFADDWEGEGWLQAIRHIELALQEKLDTKGE